MVEYDKYFCFNRNVYFFSGHFKHIATECIMKSQIQCVSIVGEIIEIGLHGITKKFDCGSETNTIFRTIRTTLNKS